MEIRDRYHQGASLSAIRRETGHDRGTIRDIVRASAPRPAEWPARPPPSPVSSRPMKDISANGPQKAAGMQRCCSTRSRPRATRGAGPC